MIFSFFILKCCFYFFFRGRGQYQSVLARESGSKKKTGARTWTGQFMYLSSPYTSKVPNSQGKQILYKAGLGMKKNKFFSDDGEQEVYKKLTSEDSENGGFPKLKGCGEFELLQCTANCRDLEVVKYAMSVKESKNHISGQGKIYIRPI